MSKNLTRKGLALGAIVALGSTVIAGSPALAANEVTLAAKTGSSYSLITGETFTLQAVVGSSIPSSSFGQLKTKITNTSAVAFTTDATQAGAAFASDGAHASTVTSVVVKGTGATSGVADIAIKVATADASDFSVQSWLDSNDNDVIDSATEFASAVQVVKFIKAADVTWTTTLTQPILAGTDAKATISASPAINLAQLAGSVTLGLATLSSGNYTAVAGSTVSQAGAFTAGELVTYDATDNVLKLSTTEAAWAAGNVVAQAIFDAAGATAGVEVGAESIKTVAAGTITSDAASDLKVAAGANTKGTGSGIQVRAETKSVAVSAQLYTSYTSATVNTKAAAGKVASVSVSARTLDATTTITVGAKTITSTTALPVKFDVTTDANGKITFDVASSTGKATDSITLNYTIEGVTGTTPATLTWVATAPAAIIDTKALGAGATRSVAKLGSYSIDYTVIDNFGQALADGYRLVAAYSSKVGTAATKYVSLSAGKGTFSVTDASTTTGAADVTVTLEKLNATTSNWETVDIDAAVASSQPSLVSSVNIVAENAAADAGLTTAVKTAATATATTAQALTATALTAVDKRVNTAATAHGLTGGFSVAGIVVDSLGSPVSGQPVTISGAGLGFAVDADVLAVDTVTVYANASGAWSVTAYSNKSGKQTITATVNGVAKTLDVTFGAAAVSGLKNTAVVAPSSSQAGRSVSVTATLTDAFGNAVEGKTVKFAVDGVGSLSGATATTDAKGVATVRLTSQYAEFGDATVTVSHDGANGTTDATDDFTVAKTISFGVTDASIDLLGKRVIVTAEFAKGKKVTVYDNGVRKYSAIQTSDAERIIAWNVKKGSHNIVVKISGGYSDNLVLSVK